MQENREKEGNDAQSSVEFVIPGESVDLLRQNVSRVKKLFNAELKFSSKFQRHNTIMQWINLTGPSAEKATNAKTYIVSMTNPDANVLVENFPPSLYLSSVDEIEMATHAFLSQRGTSVGLQGSQLAVVLAQSMLENVLQESKAESSSNEENAPSEREVTRVKEPIEVLNQDLASAVGSSSHSRSSDHLFRILPSRASGQPHQLPVYNSLSSHSYQMPADSTTNELFYVDRKGSHGQSSQTAKSSLASSNKIVVEDIAVNSKHDGGENTSASPNVGIVQQYTYLKEVGLAHGYSVDVIEEGLKRCDMTDVVQPTEFLNILKFISSKKKSSIPSLSSNSAAKSDANIPVSSASDGSTTSEVAPQKAKTKSKKSSKQPLPSKDESVILINSDSEGESGRSKLVDEIDAYVISSDEEQPFMTQKRKNPARDGSKQRGKQDQMSPIKQSQARSAVHPTLLSNSSALQTIPRGNATAGKTRQLRHIVIDGSNVAMAHGEQKVYSVKGIQICINYFLKRGHKVTALVSGSRRFFQARRTFPMKDKHLLDELEKEGNLKFTPSRRLVTGKIITSYDDRFVLNLAKAEEGIVVSNDQYRDLYHENPAFQELIENRLLPYMFVGDLFMPPDDPLGRDGPTLDMFLSMGGSGGGGTASGGSGGAVAKAAEAVPNRSRTAAAAIGKEEKGAHHSAARPKWQEKQARALEGNYWQVLSEEKGKKNEKGKEKSKDQTMTNFHQRKPPNTEPVDLLQNAQGLQLRSRGSGASSALAQRSEQKTKEIYDELSLMFTEPDQQERLRVILQNHPDEMDMTRLCNFVINALAL